MSLKQLLRMVALPTGSTRTQDSLVLKILWKHNLPDAVCTFADLLKELYRERDVSIRYSEISMKLISNGWIYGFNLPTMDEFIEEGSKVVQKGQGREKKNTFSEMLASPRLGPTRQPRYSLVMIKGPDGSESEVWFDRGTEFITCNSC